MAMITGASSGIGEVFARKLAPQYDLLLVARSMQRLTELAAELSARHGGRVNVLAADLSDAVELQGVADRIAAEPNLALLVNNAGFGRRGRFWETDLDAIESMHRLHIMALVRLSHAALRVLVPQNRGAIINLASIASFVQRAGSASYGATKSWVAAFSEGLYLDLRQAKSAVTIQALCPGFTYSKFHDVMGEDRTRIAPASFWLSAEQVVDESLAALSKGTLFVIPGWRYKWLAAILRSLPSWLKLRLETPRT
jgi:prepilin-type processing-associated H-X9-DG protein